MHGVVAFVASAAFVLAACGAADSPSPSEPAAVPAASPPVVTASSAPASPAPPSTSPPSSPSEAPSPMPSPSPAPFALSSSSFADGGDIPRKYTCDGPDRSPPISWVGAPTGTAALAIIVDDPDANGWVHWVAFDIPAATAALAEGASGTGGFSEGRTTWGSRGWRGPCPPSGTHRYVFELFALDRTLGLGSGATAEDLRRTMKGHVLGSAKLLGRYRRA